MQAPFAALKEVSLADQAYEMIRGAILESVLKPNERFTIEEMAARLGISRTPVREALKALQGDGMIRLLPHRGAMVERYAHDEIHNRYIIAAMLEGYAAELAAHADAAGLADRLEANCAELDRLCQTVDASSEEDIRKLTELNREFHNLIRQASSSQTLLRLLASLRQPTSYTMHYWQDADCRAISQDIHRKIAAAFRSGDPAAARALVEQHLRDADARIMRHFTEVGDADEQDHPVRRRPRKAAGQPA
jgi:DNA-binding GntR family transcriptional regulator